MGLNDTYIQVRSNILMMKPLPFIGTAYRILLANEKQRSVSSASFFSQQSASFHAGVSRSSATPKTHFEAAKPFSLVCKYCKKPCHTIDKCYKLHGFPPNFKFSKPPSKRTVAHVELANSGQKANTLGNDDIVSDPTLLQPSDIPGLNKGEFSKLLILLQRAQLHVYSLPIVSFC
ncbi:uncharacterized protein LOC124891421 [Capsicum annuum]|uniref:uncharacterized protein LOC124891421 n=1 Tax=Capsicum annuum TaxID=4072 RepID=UPI001FB0D25F|nr:uncharacterized protein LOC124891421 [Capsicum annuum]